jgi:hypothetical protein
LRHGLDCGYQVGIEDVFAEVLPAHKAQKVADLMVRAVRFREPALTSDDRSGRATSWALSAMASTTRPLWYCQTSFYLADVMLTCARLGKG